MSKKEKMILYPRIIKDRVSLGVTREEWGRMHESEKHSLIECGMLDSVRVDVVPDIDPKRSEGGSDGKI